MFSLLEKDQKFVSYIPLRSLYVKDFNIHMIPFFKGRKIYEFDFLYDNGYIYLVLETGFLYKIGTGYEGTFQNKFYCERYDKDLESEAPRILTCSESLFVLTYKKKEITINQINFSNLTIVRILSNWF